MALLASALPLPNLKFKAKAFGSGSRWRFHGHVSTCNGFRRSRCCSVERSSGNHVEPDNFKRQLIGISERVQEAVPELLKEFPWSKAETLLLQRLISLGKTVFKLSFVAWFAISSLSDVLTSIATNQELMVPLGLLIGCLVCDFLKEAASAMLPDAEERGLNKEFFAISSFFVIVKFLSPLFELRTQMFLLHFGNGGILQLLWLFSGMLWRGSRTIEDTAKFNTE